jgi:hypothetical protein
MTPAHETVRSEAWGFSDREAEFASLRLARMKANLLQHLKFPAIRDREDRLAKALTDTFEWIYHEKVLEDGRFKWNPFKRWLRSDSSLYWIAGKEDPGSQLS